MPRSVRSLRNNGTEWAARPFPHDLQLSSPLIKISLPSSAAPSAPHTLEAEFSVATSLHSQVSRVHNFPREVETSECNDQTAVWWLRCCSEYVWGSIFSFHWIYSSIGAFRMPKVKPSKGTHLKQIVSEFGDGIFSTDGQSLFCKICEPSSSAMRNEVRFLL